MSYRDDLRLLVSRIPEEKQSERTADAAERLLMLIERTENQGGHRHLVHGPRAVHVERSP